MTDFILDFFYFYNVIPVSSDVQQLSVSEEEAQEDDDNRDDDGEESGGDEALGFG